MRIGIDLGGTKIECIALGARGEELFRKRVATPRGDYDATLRAIGSLVGECEHAAADPEETTGIGIAHPGAISPATGLIKNANSTWLNGRAFAQDVEAMLGRPVRFANDANCFALSEATDGAGAGAAVVFGVILGTGTGGGVAVDGRVLTGPNAIAGEWGHNPLPWPQPSELPGPPCYCGRSGCIETFLSGPGLVRDYYGASLEVAGSGPAFQRVDADPGPGIPARDPPTTGPGPLAAAQIVSLAQADEPRASAALERYVERAARALASVINLLDPQVIVLGGGMSNYAGLYERVPQLWGKWIFSDRVDTQLVRAKFGDSSGVRGAAWLWNSDSAG